MLEEERMFSLEEEEEILTHLLSEYPDLPDRVSRQMQEIREGKGIESSVYFRNRVEGAYIQGIGDSEGGPLTREDAFLVDREQADLKSGINQVAPYLTEDSEFQ